MYLLDSIRLSEQPFLPRGEFLRFYNKPLTLARFLCYPVRIEINGRFSERITRKTSFL